MRVLEDGPHAERERVTSGARGSYLDERVNRMRRALAQAGTTLHQIAEITRWPPFGARTDFSIPHWFYSQLEHGGAPHLCQIIALSQITGYRVVDWMAVFGHRLDEISRVQVALPRHEPTLLSSVTYDKHAPVEWSDIGSLSADVLDETQALSELLGERRLMTVGALEQIRGRRFLYIKVGETDNSLYPHVGPGSIVRIDPERTQIDVPAHQPPVFAVHWRERLLLTFLKPARGKPGTVVLPPRYPALEQTPGHDLTIAGMADCEFRPLRDDPVPAFVKRRRPPAATPSRNGHGCGSFLRRCRERAGLNYRQVHALTGKVAGLLGHENAVVSQSCLFRYELSSTLPRHIAKIISLCVVYGVSLWELIDAAGIRFDPDAGRPMIPALADGTWEEAHEPPRTTTREPWKTMLAEVPLFLREVLPEFLGQSRLSLDSIYVCGTRLRGNNPLLQRAIMLTLDRTQRNVERVKARARHREPIFLVRTPAGQYLSGACSIQNDTLSVQPRLQTPTILASFARDDVEVIGRITGIVRLLGPDGEAALQPRQGPGQG